MGYGNRAGGLLRGALFLLAAVAAVALLLTAVGRIETRQSAEGLERLDTAIRRAAVSCYANEGSYPPTLEYLEQHYGLQVDRTQYTVYYEIFAENLMPDITVLANGD